MRHTVAKLALSVGSIAACLGIGAMLAVPQVARADIAVGNFTGPTICSCPVMEGGCICRTGY